MAYYFSPSKLAFYTDELQARYQTAGTWPTDAVAVTDAVWAQYAGVSHPDGQTLGADQTGQPAWVAAPAAPNPTTISSGAFLSRFTDAERLAIQTAAGSNASIALGLTMGLALGQITLTDATTVAWMASLVSAGALTSDRSTAILTP